MPLLTSSMPLEASSRSERLVGGPRAVVLCLVAVPPAVVALASDGWTRALSALIRSEELQSRVANEVARFRRGVAKDHLRADIACGRAHDGHGGGNLCVLAARPAAHECSVENLRFLVPETVCCEDLLGGALGYAGKTALAAG